MARPEKVAVVEEIREKLAASDAAVLTEYRGLKVGELAELRGRAAPRRRRVQDLQEHAGPPGGRGGRADRPRPDARSAPTAIAFVKGDAVIAAKALRDFAKAHEALVVKGGLLGTGTLDAGDLDALADVPPRDVLLARLAGGFQAPLVKAAGLFQAFTRNMAYGLKALIDQRVEGGEALEVAGRAEPEPPAAPKRPRPRRPRPPRRPRAEAPAAETDRSRQTATSTAETAPTEGE